MSLLRRIFAFEDSHPLLFTQIDFWVFFLLVYAGFCLIVSFRRQRDDGTAAGRARRLWRNGYLFAVSLLFYYKTSGLYVLLLVASTLAGYVSGILLDRWNFDGRQGGKGRRQLRKGLMIAGVAANLAMLCYFKYAYFFTDIFNTVASTRFSIASTILLPVGISFFTFQNISYIVDVFRGKVRHVDNLLDFGFYTSFFPQLVAGPIVRADQFVPQLYKPWFLSRHQFGVAVFWILNGLVKKIVLSDFLAVSFVDRVFDNPTLYTAFENFSALLVYSLQVYADFSGYTDIAIGVAMLMGFYLPDNFRSPYKATNAAGFWKRWHISLSNWLKDYLYIPLGGNRNATWGSFIILGSVMLVVALMARTAWAAWTMAASVALLLAWYMLLPRRRQAMKTNINNFDTMLLGGLWHGASFNFITWGALNGAGILFYKWWKQLGCAARIATLGMLWAMCRLAHGLWPAPLLSMLSFALGAVWVAVSLLETASLLSRRHPGSLSSVFVNNAYTVWNVLLTFVFISFTRLFFRSGSNLDPAGANETAWRTATQMVERIGGRWNLAQIPDIVSHYRSVFILFALGMMIHWLPERFKRRYRLWFARLPLWAMAVAAAAVVVAVMQFSSADLQPFIYFQF
ncbi:MAG: membrane bound O-acyl transferase MBOAT family protein [bacterium P3]|nr:MAG: membrane bound O-acyl transferase MBOAT family protein [bacterium P3]KWW40012.1 MAG: membrane bound O-acyl transferase MBOAT family protein [bacterium F083]